MNFSQPRKISKQHLKKYLIIFWWVIAFFSFLSSLLYMFHFDEEISSVTVFEMSFFHWVPALIWTIFTPVIFKIYERIPLRGAEVSKSLLLHFGISIVLALGLKVLALTLDFTIKYYIGLTETPVFEVLKSVVWVIPASTFKEIFLYWIAIIAIRFACADVIADRNMITVTGDQGMVPLPIDSIYWLESNKNYLDIHSKHDKYRLRYSLSTMENELNPEVFFRIHRSYIVNKDMVHTLKHWRRGEYLITLKNQKVLTSSRSFSGNVKRLIES